MTSHIDFLVILKIDDAAVICHCMRRNAQVRIKKGGVGGKAPHLKRGKPMWSISPHAVTDDSGVVDLKFYRLFFITFTAIGRSF